MEFIDLKELQKNIGTRAKEIENLKREMPQYLIFDDKLQVKIDPDKSEGAKDFINKINTLKKLNLIDSTRIARTREISNKYNLPMNRSGPTNDPPERLEIANLEAEARRRLDQLRHDLKLGRAGMGYPVLNSERERMLENEIRQVELSIKSIGAAKEEILKLFHGGAAP